MYNLLLIGLLTAAVAGIGFLASLGPRRRRRMAAAERFMRERAAKTQVREEARRRKRGHLNG
jgi:hypothetical protein